MTMLRWGAEIVGYELREDFANRAVDQRAQLPRRGRARPLPRRAARLLRGHRRDGRSTGWCSICPSRGGWCRTPSRCSTAGGILVAYTPSIVQAARLREALGGSGWIAPRTLEVLHRTWHIEGAAVRPDHRMVAHTGFLTVARFLGR